MYRQQTVYIVSFVQLCMYLKMLQCSCTCIVSTCTYSINCRSYKLCYVCLFSEDEVDETTPITPPTTRTSMLFSIVQFLILIDHVFLWTTM